MALQPPPPPSISPRQMNLLRIVASMAWADGELALEEVDVMLDRFGGIFAQDEEQRHKLQRELRDYLMQNIPLEELVPKLQSDAERKLVLKLGYEVIASSARTPDEPKVNEDEAEAYQKLIDLLGLPPEVVKEMESAVAVPESHQGLIDELVDELERFIKG
ncbi:MAG: TerB family tellurite resistance protein [Cyanobacteriota bacterium]|nr:TerB family tellurite resistance protein [Cyanobacteriota bacterium]